MTLRLGNNSLVLAKDTLSLFAVALLVSSSSDPGIDVVVSVIGAFSGPSVYKHLMNGGLLDINSKFCEFLEASKERMLYCR